MKFVGYNNNNKSVQSNLGRGPRCRESVPRGGLITTASGRRRVLLPTPWAKLAKAKARRSPVLTSTCSSAMAERPHELDQRFQMGGQFESIID